MGNDENDFNSLVHVSKERSLVARSAALAKRGLESLQTLDRIVCFPADSIGRAFFFKKDRNFYHWHELDPFQLAREGFETIEDVTGEVRVPGDKHLGLGLIYDRNLPLLSSLAPNCLDGLALGGVEFGKDCYIEHLSQLKYLALLWQSACDDSLYHLTNLKSLTHLFFYKGKIDMGLSYLANPESLSHLGLERMELSKRGIFSLGALTSLLYLNLKESNVARSDLDKLQFSLPNCEIIY